MLEIIFFLLLTVVLLEYIGYPLILWSIYIVRDLINFKDNKNLSNSYSDSLPTVSLILSCYNEEDVIEEKIKNIENINYPNQNIEVIIVSDGSTDNTASIIKKAKRNNYKFISYKKSKGKTYAQNAAVKKSVNEILVFTDANAIFKPNAISELVNSFADDKIGGVCGEVRFQPSEKKISVSKEENTYWKYEQKIKELESRITSIIGANGAIYAIRKEDYVPLSRDIISDLVEPLEVVKRGKKVIYNSNAVAFEKNEIDYTKEFHRKVRIILRSLHGIKYVKALLNPFQYGFFAIQIWLHKLLRWFIPIVLLFVFVLNFFLYNTILYKFLFWMQIIFYGFAMVALVGLKFGKFNVPKILRLPFYYCLINVAALKALLLFIRGKKITVWTPQR
ncbi:MAG TPA: glycosyltransferase family 2 protein [Bacteroidales bacterium]|nr:glycosyltransferase family 2 protein [Bacteroidales bacterium]